MPVRSFARLSLLGALAGAFALACGNDPSSTGDDGGGCPVASGCPSSGAPSYAKDVVPILDQVCLTCHGAGGSAGHDMSTYAKVFAQRSAMLDQMSACMMPPSNGPALSATQRETMTAWLDCGAPND